MSSVVEPNLQSQARALGDPTRHEVFRYVADATDPVGVAELTDHFGLNHNAIRQHLAKLVEAKLLIERTAPHTGRGRPRLIYSVDPSADSRWGVMGPYERLSVWLAEVIRSGDSPREVGRRIGRQARGTAVEGEAVEALTEEMSRQGFDPAVSEDGSSVEISLHSCPFETAAVADAGTVCELHAGMVEAVVAGMDGVQMDGFVTVDPRHSACRLRLKLIADTDAHESRRV